MLEPEKRTSYELMYGRAFKGSVCLFGESVLYKAASPYKGDNYFQRGIWVGKSHWSDCHVILTSGGAVEARSVRRLPEQFNSFDIHFAKGLPWAFSGMGILMKHGGQRKRQAIPSEVVSEEELTNMSKQIASGMATPAIGHSSHEFGFAAMTPVLAAPSTPVPTMDDRSRRERKEAEEVDEKHRHQKNQEAETTEAEERIEERDEKRQRREEPKSEVHTTEAAKPMEEAEAGSKRAMSSAAVGETSPKRERLHPPLYAGDVMKVELENDGCEDDADWMQHLNDPDLEMDIEEIENRNFLGDDDEHAPIVDEETLRGLDEQARNEEIERLVQCQPWLRSARRKPRATTRSPQRW